MKTREQALRDLGQVVAESVAIASQLTAREAAERKWQAGGPSLDDLEARIASTGICKPDVSHSSRVSESVRGG